MPRGTAKRTLKRAVKKAPKTKTPTKKKATTRKVNPAERPIGWAFTERERNSHQITTNLQNSQQRFYALVISDVHFDHPKCDRKLLERHLKEAKERQAPVISLGDFLCLMQGKGDKRHSKQALRPEYINDAYLDAVVDDAAQFLEPYAQNITMLGRGNHETAIEQRLETDLLQRLQIELRKMGSPAKVGGYSGFIRFRNQRPTGKNALGTAATSNTNMTAYYHHGYGGGGKASRGSIHFQAMRQDAIADIYMCGHTHDSMYIPVAVTGINTQGVVQRSQVDLIRAGTYKDAWSDGHSGWEVERNLGPKPLGGWWMEMWLHHSTETSRLKRTWTPAT